MLKITVRPFTVARAEYKTREKGVIFLDTPDDVRKLRQTTLVDLYNAFTGEDIKNFGSRSEAERRTVAELIDHLTVNHSKEQGTMAKKTPAATPAPAAAAPATAAAADLSLEETPSTELTEAQRTEAIAKIESDMATAKTRFNEYISKKKDELKALKTGKAAGPREPSDTIKKVLGLLRRPEGATKQQLMDETGAKAGYVGALISRILPAKGFKPESREIKDSRNKSYHLPAA